MHNALSKYAKKAFVIGFCAVVARGAAQAQEARSSGGGGGGGLDDVKFIQGLRERGMKDLLLYHLEKNPPKDPVVKMEIVIEQHKLRVEDEQLGAEERAAAVDDVLGAYRALLKAALVTDPHLPIWKTDFVEYIVRVALPMRHMNAAEFVEFGVPTSEQRAAFDRLIGEAVKAMGEASDELFYFEGELPRRDDFETAYENTGFWNRLRDEYGKLKLPFYKAWVNRLGRLMNQPRGNVSEAIALLRVTLNGDIATSAIAELRCLQGRAMIGANQLPGAINVLDQVIGDKEADALIVFTAQLAKVQALGLQKKQAAALVAWEKVRTGETAKSNPLLLTLAYDGKFRLTEDHAVFTELLSDPAAANWKGDIEQFVNGRLAGESAMASTEAKGAPAMVVLANVDALTNAAGAEVDVEVKKQKLSEALGLIKTLLARKDIDGAVRAQALFKRGVAEYHNGKQFNAAQAWVDLAARFPAEPVAAGAMTNGFIISNAVYKENKTNAEAAALFDQALVALLTKYPKLEFPGGGTALLHWHTRGTFLRESERWAEAVKAFGSVSDDHPLKVDADYQNLICEYELWLDAPAAQKKSRARQVVDAAKQATAGLKGAASGASAERAADLSYQTGDALLRQCEAMTGSLGQATGAMNLLKNFDNAYRVFPDLIQSKRSMLVGMYVATGNPDKARDEIAAFVKEFPNDGGPMIKGVLDAINRQVAEAKALDQEWKDRAEVAVELSAYLLDWAKTQPQYQGAANAGKLAAFGLIRGDQLLVAEDYDAAVGVFKPLIEAPGGDRNLDVVLGMMNASFGQGDAAMALTLGNQILRDAPNADDSRVWRAWVVRLLIKDGDYEAASGPEQADVSRLIYTSILKLELGDENLGGSPSREELGRLRVKHLPR